MGSLEIMFDNIARHNMLTSCNTGGAYMAGIIKTYQRCPKCGSRFIGSKGGFPIICRDCMTQPTKFFIVIKWKGKSEKIYHDRSGRTFHDWGHVSATLGEIRSRMADHKAGKGFFDPSVYKKQSGTAFKSCWEKFTVRYTGATHDKIDAIGRLHLSYFTDFQMRDIAAWHIDDWWEETKKKNLSTRYLNDILTWLKTFFKHALKLEIIEKVPAFPDFFSIPSPNVEQWLSEDQQLAILDSIPEHDRPIFDFLFLTGCRVNEATALKRADVDLNAGFITIRHTVKRDGSIGVVKNKKPRHIQISSLLKNCLKVKIVDLKEGWQFVNNWGRRYSDDYLRDTFNRACVKIGVKPIPLKNATRHSFGMRLVGLGLDAWRISKIMNHSDLKITEHYIKMIEGEADEIYGRGEVANKRGDKKVITEKTLKATN